MGEIESITECPDTKNTTCNPNLLQGPSNATGDISEEREMKGSEKLKCMTSLKKGKAFIFGEAAEKCKTPKSPDKSKKDETKKEHFIGEYSLLKNETLEAMNHEHVQEQGDKQASVDEQDTADGSKDTNSKASHNNGLKEKFDLTKEVDNSKQGSPGNTPVLSDKEFTYETVPLEVMGEKLEMNGKFQDNEPCSDAPSNKINYYAEIEYPVEQKETYEEGKNHESKKSTEKPFEEQTNSDDKVIIVEACETPSFNDTVTDRSITTTNSTVFDKSSENMRSAENILTEAFAKEMGINKDVTKLQSPVEKLTGANEKSSEGKDNRPMEKPTEKKRPEIKASVGTLILNNGVFVEDRENVKDKNPDSDEKSSENCTQPPEGFAKLEVELMGNTDSECCNDNSDGFKDKTCLGEENKSNKEETISENKQANPQVAAHKDMAEGEFHEEANEQIDMKAELPITLSSELNLYERAFFSEPSKSTSDISDIPTASKVDNVESESLPEIIQSSDKSIGEGKSLEENAETSAGSSEKTLSTTINEDLRFESIQDKNGNSIIERNTAEPTENSGKPQKEFTEANVHLSGGYDTVSSKEPAAMNSGILEGKLSVRKDQGRTDMPLKPIGNETEAIMLKEGIIKPMNDLNSFTCEEITAVRDNSESNSFFSKQKIRDYHLNWRRNDALKRPRRPSEGSYLSINTNRKARREIYGKKEGFNNRQSKPKYSEAEEKGERKKKLKRRESKLGAEKDEEIRFLREKLARHKERKRQQQERYRQKRHLDRSGEESFPVSQKPESRGEGRNSLQFPQRKYLNKKSKSRRTRYIRKTSSLKNLNEGKDKSLRESGTSSTLIDLSVQC